MKTRIFTCIVAVAMLVGAAPARAQWAVIDAASIGQLVLQIAESKKQVEMMLKNLQQNDQNMFKDPTSSIQKLQQIVQTGTAIGQRLGSLDQSLQAFNPDFKKKDYAGQYDKWTKSTNDTIQNSMRVVATQNEGMTDEITTLNQLADLSKSSTGALQAAQVGHQINLEMINSLNQLRQLQQSQGQATNAYMLAQQKNHEQNAQMNTFVNGVKDVPIDINSVKAKNQQLFGDWK